MTDQTEVKMNVAALKRVDPYVKDILETATHVALYTFNAQNNEWEKTNVEGALFVYSRSGEPYNSILIMNRLNTNNLVEPVTQGLDLQLQEPFLLYRNSRCNIYGIWFYDKEECVRIASVLTKLAKESEQNRKSVTKSVSRSKKSSGPNANNVDIFGMLSKAQEDFNTTRSGGTYVGSKSPTNDCTSENILGAPLLPMGPDVTSQSVMDFFAKAKVNPVHFKAGDQPTAVAVATTESSKPLLARLMSHPAAHTLEHIEKQQRSTTPQPAPPLLHRSQTTPNSINLTNSIGGSATSNRTKRRGKAGNLQDPVGSVSQEPQQTMNQCCVEDSDGSAGFLRIQSPVATTLTNFNDHRASNVVATTTANPLASLFAQATAAPTSSKDLISVAPASAPAPVPAPALIPPVMFAAPTPPDPSTVPLEPLTRNQLLQAFNYLLRSDPDFINKLHEAYVKSFSEILS